MLEAPELGCAWPSDSQGSECLPTLLLCLLQLSTAHSEEQCANCTAVVSSTLVSFQRKSNVKNTKWGSFRKRVWNIHVRKHCPAAPLPLDQGDSKILAACSPSPLCSLLFFPPLPFSFSPISFLFPGPSCSILYIPSPFPFQYPLFIPPYP